MLTGNEFYDKLPDNKKEKFKILFEDKSEWYKKDKNEEKKLHKTINQQEFDKKIKEFIKIQNNEVEYNLKYIKFPNCFFHLLFENQKIDKKIYFDHSEFEGKIVFQNKTFEEDISFQFATFRDGVYFYNQIIFCNEANFMSVKFIKEAYFDNAIFKKKSIFTYSQFEDNAYLNDSTFENTLNLNKIHFKKSLNASNMSFNIINLDGTLIETPFLLGLSGYEKEQKVPLNKNHFANKESARIIKAHFEKAGNITEANKYFVIEQEKYIDDLWSDEKYEDKRITKLIPLYLNKWVSNFGTNWVRSILFLLLFGIAFQSIFNYIKCESNATFDMGLMLAFIGTSLSYHLTYIKTRLKMKNEILVVLALFLYLLILYLLIGINNLNDIVKLLNPINAFKDKDDIFQGYETFGAFVRIVSATIIYQIIVSFRQFTRRS